MLPGWRRCSLDLAVHLLSGYGVINQLNIICDRVDCKGQVEGLDEFPVEKEVLIQSLGLVLVQVG